MQINIIGNIIGNSGYVSHTRNLANGIYEMGGDVRLDTQLPLGWEAHVNDAELNMIRKEKAQDRVDLSIDLPQNWPHHYCMHPKYFIGFCVWEGDRVPAFWIEHLIDDKVDAIFVPSEHVRKAILKTFKLNGVKYNINEKIFTIHHGVDVNKFNPIIAKKNKKCTFLANKGWTNIHNDRGGLQFVVEAFAKEFNKKDNVKLILKVNKVYNPNFDVKSAVLELVKNQDKSKLPEILITDNMISEADMNKLYNTGDIFVTASMAEGFNLPAIEAMACGLPVISTNFGGQTDFIDNKNGWLVKSKKFAQDKDLMYEGVKWAKPDITDLRKKMREAFNMWKNNSIEKKSDLALKTSSKFLWRNSGKKVLDIINDLK